MTRNEQDQYDVVVIGGGAAGLAGALMLARSKRSVVVVDGGQPRNARSAGVHGYLTRDGMPPAELLRMGRLEVQGYGGRVLDGQVEQVDRTRLGLAPAEHPFGVGEHCESDPQGRTEVPGVWVAGNVTDLSAQVGAAAAAGAAAGAAINGDLAMEDARIAVDAFLADTSSSGVVVPVKLMAGT